MRRLKMAKESGWWNIDFTVEPDDYDLEHIAELIKEGFTSGEIVETEQDDEQSDEENEDE